MENRNYKQQQHSYSAAVTEFWFYIQIYWLRLRFLINSEAMVSAMHKENILIIKILFGNEVYVICNAHEEGSRTAATDLFAQINLDES